MSAGHWALSKMAALGSKIVAPLQRWEARRQAAWQAELQENLHKFEQECSVLHSVWFPRLQEYSEECRRQRPIPELSALTPAERAQHQILLAAMQSQRGAQNVKTAFRRPHSYYTTILCTSRVGLPAAYELFSDSGAVILEESEKEHWFKNVYQMDWAEGCWWFAIAWFTLRVELTDEERTLFRSRLAALDAESALWVQWSGVEWGMLAGGADGYLWHWDGTHAESLGLYCDETY